MHSEREAGWETFDIEAARVYHEITKHSYTSVRAGAYALDWDNRPGPYKIYPEAGTMALPRDIELPYDADAGGDRIAGRRRPTNSTSRR